MELPPNIKYEDHVQECVKSRVRFEHCGSNFKSKEYLKRHIKTKHGQQSQTKASISHEDKANSDWDSDPEIELSEKEDTDLERVVRKRTTPCPMRAPPKKVAKTSSEQENVGQQESVEPCVVKLVAQASQTTSDIKHKEVQVDLLKSDTSGQRCDHCGIVFEDVAMFYVHMGCHSCNEPFKCNVCGDECQDRLRFQIHITRSHRQ